ncbi:hypothetical protein PISMIDRAFT_17437 [Pisolithus microcarpus 441]|uniref:Nucleoporin Nup188 N-terminal subdomain III domain-containing protein n=1 Tax=Pisolithus microcarpus 441 TaxID=765257 RepID=A0A0C9YBN6_9AGAM|nr:hypothetical protein PISMIDRAFT_17437 [Pisolithus microcarpus 441]
MTDDRMIDEETTDAELLNRVNVASTGEGQDEREESYFAEIDTKLAKQPAPFVGFTQLFRYIAPFELFLDAIGILDAMAAGIAQPLAALVLGRLSQDFVRFTTSIENISVNRFIWERHGNILCKAGICSSGPGLFYKNVRAIRLPDGSIIPPRSTGRLLSSDGVIDALTEYVTRRRMYVGTADLYQDVTFGRMEPGSMPLTLRLEDVGMEIDDGGDEALATDALDLVRSVIQDQPGLAEEFLEVLEIGDASPTTDSHLPDLVQLTTMILEEARQRLSSTELLAHAIRHICYECPLSTSHPSQAPGFDFVALAVERVSGQHTITLALLHLVQKLTQEAFASVVMIPADSERLNRVKEEVLLRAVNFVHGEIWVEHLGWKYVHLGDLFEIGRRISSLFSYILVQSPAIGNRPYPVLSQAIIETVMHTASSSSILPLVSAVASSPKTLGGLYASRHLGDARRLIFLFKSHLQLIRLAESLVELVFQTLQELALILCTC